MDLYPPSDLVECCFGIYEAIIEHPVGRVDMQHAKDLIECFRQFGGVICDVFSQDFFSNESEFFEHGQVPFCFRASYVKGPPNISNISPRTFSHVVEDFLPGFISKHVSPG